MKTNALNVSDPFYSAAIERITSSSKAGLNGAILACAERIRFLSQENLFGIYCHDEHPKYIVRISIGDKRQAMAPMADILRPVYDDPDINGVLIMHNHPTGNTEPSLDDRRAVAALCSACADIGCRVIDSLIVSRTTGDVVSVLGRDVLGHKNTGRTRSWSLKEYRYKPSQQQPSPELHDADDVWLEYGTLFQNAPGKIGLLLLDASLRAQAMIVLTEEGLKRQLDKPVELTDAIIRTNCTGAILVSGSRLNPITERYLPSYLSRLDVAFLDYLVPDNRSYISYAKDVKATQNVQQDVANTIMKEIKRRSSNDRN